MKAVDFLVPAKLKSVLDVTVWDVDLSAVPLVYTTLLSLVPLLAISFSVLKGFGVHNELEALLESTLEPLGDRGREITVPLMGFVENMDAVAHFQNSFRLGVLDSAEVVFFVTWTGLFLFMTARSLEARRWRG